MVWLYVILCIVCVICAVLALFVEGVAPKVIAAVLVLGAVTFGLLAASVTTVDARSVAIETKAGRFVNVLKPGRHYLAPNAEVEQWTTRYQPLPMKIPVRFTSQSKADVTVAITWAVADSGADWNQQVERVKKLWNAYKTFDDMKSRYAEPTAKTVVGNVFNVYNPFSAIDEKGADNPFISNEEWSKRVTEALGPKYAEAGLTLILAQVTDVDYDDDTENRLKATAQKSIDTRNAQQDIELAKKQAEANAARAATAKSCNELMIYLAQTNQLQNLPPAFNCGTSGGGVIVGQK